MPVSLRTNASLAASVSVVGAIAVVEQRVLPADLRDVGVLGHDPERIEAADLGAAHRSVRAQPGEVVVQPVRFAVRERIDEARRDLRRRLGKLDHRRLLCCARGRERHAQAVNEDVAHVCDVALADRVVETSAARERAHARNAR